MQAIVESQAQTLDPRSRRRHRRFGSRSIRIDLPFDGSVVNFSSSGLSIRSTGRLMVGSTYRFRLCAGSRTVDLPGRVRWCRLLGTEVVDDGEVTPVYQAGVALTESLSQKAWRNAMSRLTLPEADPLTASA